MEKVSYKMAAYNPDYSKKPPKVEFMTDAKWLAESQPRYIMYLANITKYNSAREQEYLKSYQEWYDFHNSKGRFAPGLPVYPSFSSFSPEHIVPLEMWYTLLEEEQLALIAKYE
jgi:hypothetical protein